MPLKILAIGDLHLGRVPSRLPADLRDDARRYGPSEVLERIVRYATESRIDAVVLAGDVVEHDYDFFEAYRDLRGTVGRLLAAGIRVLAVAGNHDTVVLPRLADQLEGFELIGRGGRWEQRTLTAGAERATLHGWSFPQRVVTASPLDGARLERGPGPNLGLLHCDLDQAESRYAPVATAELSNAGLDGWLLGHVHKPGELTAAFPLGYLGSATGLHPNEHGPRGPWLISIDGGRIAAVEQLPLAPLHWEHVDVDVTGIAAPEDARDLLLARVAELDKRLGARAVPPDAVGLRARFVGRSRFRGEIERMLDEERLDDVGTGTSGRRYFVESASVATAPEIDLASLAQTPSPAGLLAKRLRLLERDPRDPDRAELIRRARARLDECHDKPCWQALALDAPTDDEIAEMLRDAGLRALDALLAQQPEGAA
ncbi:MAG: metallophosphoesterase [Gammaproteobacteria bacterium]|nr:DNA repair exonuclease [Gammaproteobacteria bacterium]